MEYFTIGFIILCAILYFIILFFAPKAATSRKVKIFDDYTDAAASFILALGVIPFFGYALFIGISRFICGYSFLAVLLIAFHLHFAYRYNRGRWGAFFIAFAARFVILSVDALLFGVSVCILLIYTVNMSVSLTVLWGFCLLSIVLFITVISVLKMVSVRKFSNPILFVKNFNRKDAE